MPPKVYSLWCTCGWAGSVVNLRSHINCPDCNGRTLVDKETLMEEGLVKRPEAEHTLTEWSGAAERGLRARKEREAIINSVLIEGTHFGTIPGTPKPTLYKPGAEAVSDALNLYPDYEPVERIENFDKPLFFYRYRCRLRLRGSDAVISTGLGSCNSLEERYRWRKAERVCPKCSKPAIITGKKEYGGGFVCFKKKGGCGAKFKDDDKAITGQAQGRVPNDDPFSLVNTLDKMAQKRALVAAALNLGFSQQFTQDVEDLGPAAHAPEYPEGPPPAGETRNMNIPTPEEAADKRMKSDGEANLERDEMKISEAQVKRLWAIAKANTKDKQEAEVVVGAAIGGYGYESTRDIQVKYYEPIIEALKK